MTFEENTLNNQGFTALQKAKFYAEGGTIINGRIANSKLEYVDNDMNPTGGSANSEGIRFPESRLPNTIESNRNKSCSFCENGFTTKNIVIMVIGVAAILLILKFYKIKKIR